MCRSVSEQERHKPTAVAQRRKQHEQALLPWRWQQYIIPSGMRSVTSHKSVRFVCATVCTYCHVIEWLYSQDTLESVTSNNYDSLAQLYTWKTTSLAVAWYVALTFPNSHVPGLSCQFQSQSACLSWCQALIWYPRLNFLLPLIIFRQLRGLLKWGALSDERSYL
jgi:hypothetical protein